MSVVQNNLSGVATALPEETLQKKLTPLNVWALALGCIIGWGAFIMPGEIFLVKAGPLGMALAMLAATIILIIIATNYYYMIKRYPVAGGEFIYVNATFDRKNAFICSWFLALCFSKLHSKYKTPRNAILFILAVSVIAPFMGRTVLGWIVDMASLGAAVGYGYTSLVAYKYAKNNGDTAIQITGLLGFAFSILFAILLLIPIPYFNISLGRESYLFLLVWTIIGYYFYNARGKGE